MSSRIRIVGPTVPRIDPDDFATASRAARRCVDSAAERREEW